jgi:hypothetical protein
MSWVHAGVGLWLMGSAGLLHDSDRAVLNDAILGLIVLGLAVNTATVTSRSGSDRRPQDDGLGARVGSGSTPQAAGPARWASGSRRTASSVRSRRRRVGS